MEKIESPDAKNSVKDEEDKLTVVTSRPYHHPHYIRDFVKQPLYKKVSESVGPALPQDLVDLIISYLRNREEVDIPANLSTEEILTSLSPYLGRDGVEFIYRLPDLPIGRIHDICNHIKSKALFPTSPILPSHIDKSDAEHIWTLYSSIESIGKIGFFSKKKAAAKEKAASLAHEFFASSSRNDKATVITAMGYSALLFVMVFLLLINTLKYPNSSSGYYGFLAFLTCTLIGATAAPWLTAREEISQIRQRGHAIYNRKQLKRTSLPQKPAGDSDGVTLPEGFYDPNERKGFRPL